MKRWHGLPAYCFQTYSRQRLPELEQLQNELSLNNQELGGDYSSRVSVDCCLNDYESVSGIETPLSTLASASSAAPFSASFLLRPLPSPYSLSPTNTLAMNSGA